MKINPRNIHCLALNYGGVEGASQEPLYFVKSLSCLCSDGAKVIYPKGIDQLWTEVELGIVLKRDGFEIPVNKAEDFIEGFIVCADITCNSIYKRDHHLAFSKARKNFCPVGADIAPVNILKKKDLELATEINGKLTQKGRISQMIYNPLKSLSYVSHLTALEKGDILLTGTPPGYQNNMLKKGDKVRHTIDEIGSLAYEIV